MKRLLVISNHAPEKWSEKQKEGWDKIEFIPFPNVPADMSLADIIGKLTTPICQKIGEFYSRCDEENAKGYVSIQGEFSLCKAVFDALHGEDINWLFPTTERKTIEKVKEDGSVEKISVFEFVQWRES
jgi:hypothetical protein